MLNVVQSQAFVPDLKPPLPLRFMEERVETRLKKWQQISGALFRRMSAALRHRLKQQWGKRSGSKGVESEPSFLVS